MVADVPVGVLLSGGADSSLITAMAARATGRVKTFTVRFPGFGAFDETPHARLIARHFETEHHELDSEDASVDLLPVLARQFDEPLADSSMIPTFLVSRLVRRHCTVALGGDGGDELFGGYPYYPRFLRMQQRLARVPRAMALAGAGVGRLLAPHVRGRNWMTALATDFATGLPFVSRLFDPADRRRLLNRPEWPLEGERIREARVPPARDLLQRATRLDFENFLAEDILVKVDRASMANSLEVRAPLLDYRLVEFAFGRLTSRQRATVRERKVLLRRLCRKVLPPAFDERRKQGFSVPLNAWLARGPWHDAFRETLADPASMFDRSTALALLDRVGSYARNGERLFALVMFELWRREYRATL
jgi:asparagine synthase (glutamine-hydrolysing)